MKLYLVYFRDQEWGCYVVAPSRGRAKSLFYEYWRWDGEYTDIRCRKLKSVDQKDEKLYDTNCPELEAMGVSFRGLEEEEE